MWGEKCNSRPGTLYSTDAGGMRGQQSSLASFPGVTLTLLGAQGPGLTWHFLGVSIFSTLLASVSEGRNLSWIYTENWVFSWRSASKEDFLDSEVLDTHIGFSCVFRSGWLPYVISLSSPFPPSLLHRYLSTPSLFIPLSSLHPSPLETNLLPSFMGPF